MRRRGSRSRCAAGAATRRRDCLAPTRRSGGSRRTPFIGARGRTSGPRPRGARRRAATPGDASDRQPRDAAAGRDAPLLKARAGAVRARARGACGPRWHYVADTPPALRDGAIWALAGGRALFALHPPPPCTTAASTRPVPGRTKTHTTEARRPTVAHRQEIEALSRSVPGGLVTAAHPTLQWLYQAGCFRRRPGKK